MPGVRKKKSKDEPEKMKIVVFATVPAEGFGRGFNNPDGVMRNYILDKVEQTLKRYGLTDVGFIVDKRDEDDEA